MTSPRFLRLTPASVLGLALTLPLLASAQERLVGVRTTTLIPVWESWTFGDGVAHHVGGDSVTVSELTELSLPFVGVIPLGDRVTVDIAGAYSSGTVRLADRDATLGVDRYQLSGPTNTKAGLVARRVGDGLLLTLGANAPTGHTSLDGEELAALRVLAAPALRLQVPALGAGPGGTAGMVLATRLGDWAWALGVSYEMRGKYAPIAAITAGAPSPDFDPGDVLHFSLGLDGFFGQHGMTLALSTDLYTEDEFRVSGSVNESTVIQLGPTASAEWQLRLAAQGWRELTLYAVDRYRTKYKQGGQMIEGTSGNQLDGGLRAVRALSPGVGLAFGLEGRHHTGLKVDRSIATAGYAGGAITLGIQLSRGGFAIQPFARGQVGSIDSGGEKARARGLAGGLTIAAGF